MSTNIGHSVGSGETQNF